MASTRFCIQSIKVEAQIRLRLKDLSKTWKRNVRFCQCEVCKGKQKVDGDFWLRRCQFFLSWPPRANLIPPGGTSWSLRTKYIYPRGEVDALEWIPSICSTKE
jgi:hypothetical protein